MTKRTGQAIYNACKTEWPGQPARPQLSFRLLVDLAIAGKIGSVQVGTTISPFNRPFQLPPSM